MKTDYSFLPPNKQAELKAIVGALIPRYGEVEMIILFGSYARGKQVEDKYEDKGIIYEYKSDYDLLIIFNKNQQANNDTLMQSITNETESQVVKQVYDDFLDDKPFTIIKERALAKGVKLKAHDALTRILTNHTYGGLILTPNYKDDTSKVVKGIHEGIIPEEKFWKAYYKLHEKLKPQGPKIIDENVPLRGFILCQSCGGMLTGGKSKGRSNYYYYYRCKKMFGRELQLQYSSWRNN